MEDFRALAIFRAAPFGVGCYVKAAPMKGIKPNDDASQTSPLIPPAHRRPMLKKHRTA